MLTKGNVKPFRRIEHGGKYVNTKHAFDANTTKFIHFKFLCLTKSLTNKFILYKNIINNESITIHNVPITISSVQQKTAYEGGSIIVWVGISVTGRTQLVRTNSNLSAQWYIIEILTPHVAPLCSTGRTELDSLTG